jgi:hypothetical protein
LPVSSPEPGFLARIRNLPTSHLVAIVSGTVLMCCLVLAAAVSAQKNAANRPERRSYCDESYLEQCAKEWVKSELNFPEEASFGSFFDGYPVVDRMPQKDADIVLDGRSGEIWSVAGEVTAKNGFGVKSKIRWVVMYRVYEDGKTIVYERGCIKFGDKMWTAQWMKTPGK